MIEPIFFSIIIPTYHRNEQLAQCLDRLAPGAQEGLKDSFEVIVTDDGTTTTSKDMVAQRYPWARWIEGAHGGPAANRNSGAQAASGKWLVFTDDDCLPDKAWLAALAAHAHTSNFDVLEGRTEAPPGPDNPFMFYVENPSGGNYWSCNLAVSRTAFFELGQFDKDFLEAGGEDMEFAHRLKAHKLRAMFIADAVVVHPARRMDLRQLIWRTFMIRWKVLFDIKAGYSPPLQASTYTALTNLVSVSATNLMRSSWHLLSRPNKKRWHSQTFHVLWQWLTFPIVLPYMMVWDMRFRRMLKNRGTTN